MSTFLHSLWRTLALIVALAVAPPLSAATQVDIGDVRPADGSVLAPDTSVYVLMNYETDTSVRLWVRPYAGGTAVAQALSNTSAEYSGSGQALGWFALREPGIVDEIRIIAGGGDPYREWQVTSLPIWIEWKTGGATATARPAWVAELQQQQAELNAAAARQRASEPAGASDMLLFSGFAVLVVGVLVGGIVLPIRSALRWRGGWRIAAFAPLGLMAFVVLRIVVDTALDPTSHNLWPFELLMYGAVALVIVGVLTIARRILGVRE